MIVYKCDRCNKEQKSKIEPVSICMKGYGGDMEPVPRLGVDRIRKHEFDLCRGCIDEIYEFIDKSPDLNKGEKV